jgi:hypothetical protein
MQTSAEILKEKWAFGADLGQVSGLANETSIFEAEAAPRSGNYL